MEKRDCRHDNNLFVDHSLEGGRAQPFSQGPYTQDILIGQT